MQTRIKELRKERKLHQSELAAKINVSIDYLLYQTASRRTPDFQIEFNDVLEKNYRLCKLYENLSPQNQDLILSLAEQLKEKER